MRSASNERVGPDPPAGEAMTPNEAAARYPRPESDR